MSPKWVVKLNQNLWEKVPAPIHAEGTRLKELLTKYCCSSYAEKEITVTLGLWLEDGSVPFKRKGLRLESPIKNIVGASIFVTKSEWSIPITEYRAFLWENVERAIWGCIGTLKKKQIVVDIDDIRLRHDLAQVQGEFLGVHLESEALASAAMNGEISSDQTATNEMNRIVVQYKIKGHGNGRDHDKRVAVENLLGEFLEEADLGYCDGGDIGSGTMNVFCFVKPERGVVKKIIEVLRKNSLLDGATIAETVADEERVIWPSDFKGEFKLIYR
jgi:hypothetical protein